MRGIDIGVAGPGGGHGGGYSRPDVLLKTPIYDWSATSASRWASADQPRIWARGTRCHMPELGDASEASARMVRASQRQPTGYGERVCAS